MHPELAHRLLARVWPDNIFFGSRSHYLESGRSPVQNLRPFDCPSAIAPDSVTTVSSYHPAAHHVGCVDSITVEIEKEVTCDGHISDLYSPFETSFGTSRS